MRVRLTTDRAGPLGLQHDGEIVDLPRAEALRLIHRRQAEAIEPEAADAESDTETRAPRGKRR